MTVQDKQLSDYPFLKGKGEIGELIVNHHWGLTSLGEMDKWPVGLKINLNNILNSSFPMFLFWGEELICFYNEAFRPSFGTEGKHPAIGKKAIIVWGEIWYFIGPLLQQVMVDHKPVMFEDQLVPFHRNGKVEDIYWTFCYSPAFDENNEIKGVLVTCIETTKTVLERQKNDLNSSVK